MEITQYRDEFKTEVIELILDIQNNEAKVNMPIECQPDLLGITDAYINRGGDFLESVSHSSAMRSSLSAGRNGDFAFVFNTTIIMGACCIQFRVFLASGSP